jgi:hypothetical protein
MGGYKPGATHTFAVTDDTRQVWLVERDYNDKGLVTLVYATPDGERAIHRHRSSTMLSKQGVTAASEAAPADLQPVEDSDRRERYAQEVERMIERHDPDDEI